MTQQPRDAGKRAFCEKSMAGGVGGRSLQAKRAGVGG